MIIDDKTRNQKFQYEINRATANIFSLSLGNINKYEYLPSEGYCPHSSTR